MIEGLGALHESVMNQAQGMAGISRAMQEAHDAEALTSRPPRINTSGILPTEFKVLIAPKAVEDKIGSIFVPESKKDADKYATIEGRIVALSHLAFTYATEAEWDGKKPKPGDRVLFAKYAGVRHKGRDGTEYVLANDKDIVAILED